MASLLLGPILLQDMEVPERIRWGGAQRLAVHRLPGGARVIDALGRDDAEIVWTGVFTGTDAMLRARGLDQMRAEGGVWPLTWDSFFYSVVVACFEADYTRNSWIPYRIACTVLRDEIAAVATAAVSLATSMLSDLTDADGFGSGVDLAGAVSAAAVPGATTPGSAAWTQARGALASASGQVDAGIAGIETRLVDASVGGAKALDGATGLAGQLAALAAARGYVRRASANQTAPEI